MTLSSSDPAGQRREIDPLALYASAIDTSNYVAQVAPLIRRHVPTIGDLLDVGSGGGQLGHALRDPAGRWAAIEPSPSMRLRLSALDHPPQLVAAGWHEAGVPPERHDTVLAATMPATMDEPEAFLARCRSWTRRAVVWVVPAHAGPRGLCFAGCLPLEWHGEDETPGIDIVLRGLSPSSMPRDVSFADWTFTGIVPDLDELATYLADRLGWSAADDRRARMRAHLSLKAKREPAGFRLEISRKSAVLVWGKS
ncbi:MAG: class I SAM-dependent methyltransferase [Rhodospirillaceae bacterium]|nr:class I SAM-dependent methyltransferase [Rhodospirillaceae bacterium]